MIRFNCPTCGRHYELPNALSGLPLVCKQCGQRVTPPAPSPDAPPPARPVARLPTPVAAPKPPPVALPKPAGAPKPAPAPAAPVKPFVPPPDEPDDADVLIARPDSTPDIDFNIGGPTAASLSDAARTRTTGRSDATRGSIDLGDAVGPRGDSIPDLDLVLLGPTTAALPKAPPPPAPPEPPAPEEEQSEPTMLPFLADLGVFLLLVVFGLFLGEFLANKQMGQVLSEAGSAPKFPPVDLVLLVGPPVAFGLIYLLLGSRDRTPGAWLRRRRSR